jgi:glyoxylase-like metal-dependent hydrolase (beta-lactamase superfamily II)
MVDPGAAVEVAPGVHVLPDRRIDFVPNAGIVLGDRAALVVETAMGHVNGERILATARELAGGRPLLLTTTHFHPEHAFGARPFMGEATYVCNAAQAAELRDKGPEYVEMFSGFGPHLAELLEGVELVAPHVAYEGPRARIDLGGREVELLSVGPAHTRGDQLVFLPSDRVLFAGDLVEERFLPIFPDADASGDAWLAVLDDLDALRPAVLVPGHGAVGGAEQVADLRAYLQEVRAGVAERGDAGADAVAAELEPALAERYAGWGNQMWIRSAIDAFHADLRR